MKKALMGFTALALAGAWLGILRNERSTRLSQNRGKEAPASPINKHPAVRTSNARGQRTSVVAGITADRPEMMLSSDPGGALRGLLSRPGGHVYLRATFAALAQEFGRDALEFVSVLDATDSAARFEAYSGVLDWPLRRGDIDLAREWLQHVPDDLRVRVAARLTEKWSASNTVEAAWWVTELPEGDERARIIAALVDDWATRAPSAAEHFVRYMPASSAQREMLAALRAHHTLPAP